MKQTPKVNPNYYETLNPSSKVVKALDQEKLSLSDTIIFSAWKAREQLIGVLQKAELARALHDQSLHALTIEMKLGFSAWANFSEPISRASA